MSGSFTAWLSWEGPRTFGFWLIGSLRRTSGCGVCEGSTLDLADVAVETAVGGGGPPGRRRAAALGTTFLPDLLSSELPKDDMARFKLDSVVSVKVR